MTASAHSVCQSNGTAPDVKRGTSNNELHKQPQVLISPIGLEFPSSISYAGWALAGAKIARIANSSAWCLGDWLVWGQDRYPERYEKTISEVGLEYKTLRNYAWVARRVEASRRRSEISFQHHAEVASLSSEEQIYWLGKAVQLRWSRNQLRTNLRNARQLPASVTRAISKPAAIPSIDVSDECLMRWQAAAERSSLDLASWIVAALDLMADKELAENVHNTV